MPDRLDRSDELITDTLVISLMGMEPNDTKRAYPGGDLTAGQIGRSSVCTTGSADTISSIGRAVNLGDQVLPLLSTPRYGFMVRRHPRRGMTTRH